MQRSRSTVHAEGLTGNVLSPIFASAAMFTYDCLQNLPGLQRHRLCALNYNVEIVNEHLTLPKQRF